MARAQSKVIAGAIGSEFPIVKGSDLTFGDEVKDPNVLNHLRSHADDVAAHFNLATVAGTGLEAVKRSALRFGVRYVQEQGENLVVKTMGALITALRDATLAHGERNGLNLATIGVYYSQASTILRRGRSDEATWARVLAFVGLDADGEDVDVDQSVTWSSLYDATKRETKTPREADPFAPVQTWLDSRTIAQVAQAFVDKMPPAKVRALIDAINAALPAAEAKAAAQAGADADAEGAAA